MIGMGFASLLISLIIISFPYIDQGIKTSHSYNSDERIVFSYLVDKKESLIKEGKKFIEADLSNMELTLYDGSEILRKFKILTKGRKGSW